MIKPIAPDYGTNFLLPPALEDWVGRDHPVRFLREYVDALDLAALGFAMPQATEGRPPYAVGLLLKIWLYGYWHQIRSHRRLERACGNELPLLWLAGMIRPDHNSLWRFWRDNQKAIRRLFKQSVELAMKSGLVGLVVQALDGTKVQAVASGQSGWSKAYMEELLAVLAGQVAEAEKQIEQAGPVPPNPGSGLPADLQDKKQLQAVIRQGLAQLEQTQREHYHPQEPEARRMKCEGRQPFAYNAQAVVDSQARIITAAEVTQAEDDAGHLVPMLEQAKANTGGVAQANAADGGYGSGGDLKAAQDAGYQVVAPVREGTPAKDNPYHAHHFKYDETSQSVICPQGQNLDFQRAADQKGQTVRIYRCHCTHCPVRPECSQDPKGRKIEIWQHTAAVQTVRARLKTEAGKKVLRQRSQLIEWVFAVIKSQYGFRRWTVRGLEKVRTQWAMLCLTVNLRSLWGWWKKGTLRLRTSG